MTSTRPNGSDKMAKHGILDEEKKTKNKKRKREKGNHRT